MATIQVRVVAAWEIELDMMHVIGCGKGECLRDWTISPL